MSKTKHESFGLAGFSRSSIGGGGIPLFGSSILHNNVISFKVQHAEVDRHLEQDWYHAANRMPIVEITMSQSQFAEMITSMNMGEGIPVTINQIYEKSMEPCPHENKRMKHSNEFKERMKAFGSQINTYGAAILKKIERLPKRDQEEIKKMVDQVSQEVRSNIPFYEDQFSRQMDKTVTEAKAEVESFVEGKIRSTGLTAIKDQNKMISLE